MSSFLNRLGDMLVPNEIAPYLGMLAPMVAPQLGIVGSMALSQLGSIKQYDGALDPYSAIATGIALSTPQARAIRRAGRLDPTRGTVGQRLSAGIAASLPGEGTGALYRGLDPRLSMRKNKFGNYFENPILAKTEGTTNIPLPNRLMSPFDKDNFQGGNKMLSDTEFRKGMQETYDYQYGKKPTLGDDFVEAKEGTPDQIKEIENRDAEDNIIGYSTETIKGTAAQDPSFPILGNSTLTQEQKDAYLDIFKDPNLDFSEKQTAASEYIKNLPLAGGKETLLSKAGDIGSQVAGAIMPGFSDYDPLTGEFSEFNFEKALLTVGVSTTLGGLKAIAEKIKKEEDMSEAEEKAIWKEWFDAYEKRAKKPYSETNYPDEFLMEKYQRYMLASGGRVGYNMGGLSGGIMGSSGVPQGMQVDGRNGAFIPMGVEEKADDVPAMLSKNEFVMTADAVKAAGDGDANRGAQRMYDLMHNLEAQV